MNLKLTSFRNLTQEESGSYAGSDKLCRQYQS